LFTTSSTLVMRLDYVAIARSCSAARRSPCSMAESMHVISLMIAKITALSTTGKTMGASGVIWRNPLPVSTGWAAEVAADNLYPEVNTKLPTARRNWPGKRGDPCPRWASSGHAAYRPADCPLPGGHDDPRHWSRRTDDCQRCGRQAVRSDCRAVHAANA